MHGKKKRVERNENIVKVLLNVYLLKYFSFSSILGKIFRFWISWRVVVVVVVNLNSLEIHLKF